MTVETSTATQDQSLSEEPQLSPPPNDSGDSFIYAVTKLVFSDGTAIDVSADDIIVLVGPNNAGKSAALREIVELVDAPRLQNDYCKVVTQLGFDITRDKRPLQLFLSQLESVPSHADQFGRMGNSSTTNIVLSSHEDTDALRRHLRAFCMYHVTTESRLHVTKPTPAIDLDAQQKSHPYHYLYDDATLEDELSRIFAQAFDTDLSVDRFGGSVISLRVGKKPGPSAYSVNPEYRSALRKLPSLNTQGDGMRAFVGCLMWACVADYHILLIDEPEAFLHPPQARLLGRTLAKRKKDMRQIVLATHSGDFLRGLLDTNPKSLRVLRIVRDGDVNRVHALPPGEVRALWSDPLLRQSNTLDGLFHSRVILCEADGDCQFYSAMANALAESVEGRNPPDAMFIHCGGKDRMPKVVNALRAVNVPLTVIADFDVLREEKPLRPIFEGLGGNWSAIEKDFRRIQQSISSLKAQLDTADLKLAIQQSLEKATGAVVQDEVLDEIRSHTRKASAWAYAKIVGETFVPPGESYAAYQRLKKALASQGLQIVHVGEIESFCKAIPLHGPAWVAEVSKREFPTDPDLKSARDFIEGIFWPKKDS